MRRTGLLALIALGALSACDGEQAAPAQRGPRQVPVRAAKVERGDLQVTSQYPGELFADAVDLAPRLSGRLSAVPVRLGDAVKKGQVVARLDDAELRHQLDEAQGAVQAAEARGRQAAANLEVARGELERKAPLAEDRLVSAQELAELRARVEGQAAQAAAADAEAVQARARIGMLRKQLGDMQLLAPFDGTVAERRLEPGAAVGPGTPVVRLVAGGPPQVRFRVPERDLGLLGVGLPIVVRTAATGDVQHPGKVTRLGTEISRTDRAVQVEGVLDEAKPGLLAGAYATVELQSRTIEDALVVPAASVLERNEGGEQRVGLFVAQENTARWRPVEVLGSRGGRTAVKAELREGDLVLTLGHDDLSDGSPIQVVPAAGSGGGAAPDTAGAPAAKGANG